MECLSQRLPTVVIVDVVPEVLHRLIREVQRRSSTSRVVAVGLEENDNRLVELAEFGVAGFVLRDASLAELIAAVRYSLDGDLKCSPRMAGALARRVRFLSDRRVDSSVLGELTNREKQILGLIDQGQSNKEIASCLSIEVPTVKSHVHSILEKLQVHRRGEAAARLAGRVP